MHFLHIASRSLFRPMPPYCGPLPMLLNLINAIEDFLVLVAGPFVSEGFDSFCNALMHEDESVGLLAVPVLANDPGEDGIGRLGLQLLKVVPDSPERDECANGNSPYQFRGQFHCLPSAYGLRLICPLRPWRG